VAVAIIIASAAPRLSEPRPSTATGIGLAIMAASAAATGALALYLRRRASQTSSRVLRSESIHAAADALISVGVLGAIGGSALGLPRVDPIVALGVAGIVAWRGWLVGGAADETDAAAVDTTIQAGASVPGVDDCHSGARGRCGHVRVVSASVTADRRRGSPDRGRGRGTDPPARSGDCRGPCPCRGRPAGRLNVLGLALHLSGNRVGSVGRASAAAQSDGRGRPREARLLSHSRDRPRRGGAACLGLRCTVTRRGGGVWSSSSLLSGRTAISERPRS
jgi:hypothetical protein